MYAKTLIKLAKRTKLLEGKGCADYKMKCQYCLLYSLTTSSVTLKGSCSCYAALKEYINTKLEPEEKLEFLIAVYN